MRTPSPMIESVMRTQERMRQSAPMRVRPSSVTPGWMIVPRPIATPSSMKVVEGRGA